VSEHGQCRSNEIATISRIIRHPKQETPTWPGAICFLSYILSTLAAPARTDCHDVFRCSDKTYFRLATHPNITWNGWGVGWTIVLAFILAFENFEVIKHREEAA
jgi:hypothetical protein